MDPKDESPKPLEPKGFESLLNQNEIAEAKERVINPPISLEERIRAEAPKKIPSTIKSLRTFRGDIEESVASGKTTPISIATAEANVRKKLSIGTIVNSPKTKSRLIVAASALFILLGIGALAYGLSLLGKDSPTTPGTPTLLIRTEQVVSLDTTGREADEIKNILIDGREGAQGQLNTMIAIIPTVTSLTSEGTRETMPLSSSQFFSALELNAPGALVRSFGNDFLFAIHIFDGNQPFLILDVDSYEAAFSGMLSWEEVIVQDLGPVLRKESELSVGTGAFAKVLFEDAVVKNVDARVLKNQDGKTILLYAFPQRNLLIIATNPETFGEILARLGSRSVVR